MANDVHIVSAGPEQTQQIGRVIGEQARAGDIFLLTGSLGAGKTCFTQGLAQGLDVPGYVRSPTFVLITQHQGRLKLFHLDLYRIEDPREAWDLGLDEQLFGDGVCVVEWADRAADLFPPESMWVHFNYRRAQPGAGGPTEENLREIAFSGGPPRYGATLEKLAETLAGGPSLPEGGA